MKNSLILTLILLVTFIASGCSQNNSSATKQSQSSERLTVYTTIFPIKDFTKKIGGDHVKVTNLIPAGADGHTFEPTPQTMMKVAESKALIYNGANMEGYIKAMQDSLQDEEVVFFEAAKGIELRDFHGHEEEGKHGDDHEGHSHSGNMDPHVWLDPVRAIAVAENIKDALIELQPEAKQDFQENYETLKTQLQDLNASFTNMVESTPKDTFLVSHAAYGYWEGRYGLNQLSLSGLSPTDEPSQKQLQEIIEKAEAHNIKYVLFEQNISQKTAKVIQEEIDAKSLRLYNLSSPPKQEIEDGEDYFNLMKKNIETLKEALR